MKGLTIALIVIFIFFMILWKLFGYFAGQVPALAVLVSPFLWLWIGALIGAAILSVLLIIKEFRKHKGE